MTWSGPDGWRVPYPTGLREAVREIPGADRLTEEQIDGCARAITCVSELGRGQEMPRFRGASQVATDRQLIRLDELPISWRSISRA